jgi:hypothetical protein
MGLLKLSQFGLEGFGVGRLNCRRCHLSHHQRLRTLQQQDEHNQDAGQAQQLGGSVYLQEQLPQAHERLAYENMSQRKVPDYFGLESAGRVVAAVSNLPLSMSASMRKSLINDHQGCPKVAGLFFSRRKCPVQAQPYATGIHSRAQM